MEIEAIAKCWGSSIGIIIPKEIVEANRIRENDKVIVEIKKRPLAREFFGRYPHWKRSTQEIKDEARKEWESKKQCARSCPKSHFFGYF